MKWLAEVARREEVAALIAIFVDRRCDVDLVASTHATGWTFAFSRPAPVKVNKRFLDELVIDELLSTIRSVREDEISA